MSARESRLRRTSLSHVALATPDVERLSAFYADTMGLIEQRPSEVAGGVCLGWGAGHHALELLPGAPGLAHIAFEVLDEGGPERIAERAQAMGVAVRDVDAAGTLEVNDPDGNPLRLHGRVARTAEHTADPGRRPVRVQHATLATASLAEMVDCYVGLGFRVSDRMGTVFTWLRSTVEHHSVAIVDVGRSGGLDHYSFDLDGWSDFKVWADRLTDLGVDVQWGPGRHGPGNNLFLFFDDPDGSHIELSAEMERSFDDRVCYEPRDWAAAPTTVNLWGGQVPSWRSA
jgi:catechol 2,3-dioxygenase-like lactoylglutathione lyase family enzyme